jgi:RHS repeat-associated protein
MNALAHAIGNAITRQRSCICYRLHSRTVARLLAVFAIAGPLLAAAGFAQTPPAVGNPPASLQVPTPGAGHDYVHLLSETVDPSSGNLTIRITFPTPPGRGITVPALVLYNSGELTSLVEPNGQLLWATSSINPRGQANGWGGTSTAIPLSGTAGEWNYTAPIPPGQSQSPLTCNYASGFQFTDAHGTQHALGLGAMALESGGTNCGNTSTDSGWDGQVQAVLASNWQTQLANGNGISVTAQDIAGNTYNFGTPGIGGGGSGQATMEDRNGNMLTTTTDTVGHPLVIEMFPGSQSQSYTVGGISYTIVPTTTTVAYQPQEVAETWEEGAANCNVTGIFGENSATITVISAIQLPNGQEYQFFYDSTFGTVKEIIYPDGGWVKYNWGWSTDPQIASSFPAEQEGTGEPMTNACTFEYYTPVVLSRTVSFDGTTTAQTQSFNYSTTWNSNDEWTSKSASVWTTDNKVSGAPQFETKYNYLPYGPYVAQPFSTGTFDAQMPLETSVQHFDWGNPAPSTPLDSVTKAWYNQFQEACEVHTLNNGESYGHFYQWTDGLISDDQEYDFQSGSGLASDCLNNTPPGSPTRETKTYLYQFESPVSPHFTFAKPCSVMVFGNGTETAQTTFNYDESTVAAVSSLTSHDESNFGSSFPGTPQRYSPSTCASTPSAAALGRGNVTTASKCISFSGGTCTSWATTEYTYDEAGQIMSAIDPCGNGTCTDMPTGTAASHTSTYSFLDSYSSGSGTPPGQTDAYLTLIKYPTENEVTPQQSFEYRYTDGQLSQGTDENSNVTTYSYGTQPSQCGGTQDTLNRLTQITYPTGGGQTQFCYNDGTYNGTVPNVTKFEQQSSSAWVESITRSDGMSHVWQTEIMDPEGTADSVETAYDGEGRVYTKTNPHRPTTLSTDGTTTNYYNAAGQSVAQQQPDGSWLNWCYNGIASQQPSGSTSVCTGHLGQWTNTAWVDSTDETGRHWQRSSDSFGRLLMVMEPNASNSPALETDYAYDALNDLTSANQWGGAYGSSGDRQRSFSYDGLGRLLTAQNPETGTDTYSYDFNSNLLSKTDARSESVWYCYDFLNRILSKAYSQQSCPASTFAANYAYDVAAPSWGQQANQTNLIGRLSRVFANAGAVQTVDSAFGYDTMGRVDFESTCTSSCFGTQYIFTATHDLIGELTQLEYPDTRVVTWSWDTAQHLTQVQFASWSSQSVNYNYLSTASYWPDGAPMTMTVGNGLTTTWNRNDRLQPTEIILQNTANTKLLDRQYCYGTASVSGANCPGTPTQPDNGNILQIADQVTSSNTQTMTYDNLNRIATFTNNTNPATMEQTYSIDAWGNTIMYGTQVNGLAFGGTSNRDTSGTIGYDADGNATSIYNGLTTNTFVYDPESRISSINSGATTYWYDADSQRAGKSTGSVWTQYLSFGGEPLVENNSNTTNGEFTDFIFANGMRIAEADTNSPTSPSTTTNYYSSDQVHSTALLTNGSGSVVESYEYYPFGVGGMPDSNNHYLFTGKERDAESGNDYFGARYYASAMGRFLSPDWSAKEEPIPYAKLDNPQTLNLYAYVGNDPLSDVDADGHNGSPVTCSDGDAGQCGVGTNPFKSEIYTGDGMGPVAGDNNWNQPELDREAAAEAQQQNAQAQTPTAAPAPTTQYNGVPAAGIAAEQTYNPASKDLNREFNGNIYQNAQGQCCFIQTPNIGTVSTSSPPGVSTLPSGATRVATFHTHGANSHGVYDDEHFSPADKSNARARGVPIFVGTPGGVIREYNPHGFIFHRTITFKETAP